MKNLKVSMKFVWPHIVILLLFVAGIAVSFVSFTNVRKQVEALYHGSFVVKNAADTAQRTFESMQVSVFRAISNDSQDITGEAAENAKNGMGIIQEQAALLKQNTLADTSILSRLEEYLSELAPMQEHVLALAAQNKNLEAAEYMEARIIPVIEETQKELAQLIESADAKEIQLVASLQQTQKNAIILLISFGAASVLFSVGIAAYIWQMKKKGKQSIFCPVQMTR